MMKSNQFSEEISRYHDFMVQNKKDSRLSDPTKLASVINHMQMVYTRKTILFCVDVEAWEHDTRQITEVGVSIYDPRGQEFAIVPNIQTIHFIIEENQFKKNGRYVPEHSKNFSGKVSHILSRKSTSTELQILINKYFYQDSFPCTLVGHDVGGDISWLRSMLVRFPNGIARLDTQTLFAYSYGQQGSSLKNALTIVNQPFSFLHNAGNDAYFTILLALKLCDPSVRTLLNFDVIPAGEDRNVPKKYPKLENNRSGITYGRPQLATSTSQHLFAQ